MSKKQFLMLIVVFILLFTSCTEKTKFSALSSIEVQEFISINSINACAIKNADDFTVVLYDNEQEYGHYVLYKDQNNKLYNNYLNVAKNTKDNQVYIGGVASGKTNFVTIIINDENILKKAKEIEVYFSDGTKHKQTVSSRGAIVLHHNIETNNETVNYTNLIIYDRDMRKIYEENKVTQ